MKSVMVLVILLAIVGFGYSFFKEEVVVVDIGKLMMHERQTFNVPAVTPGDIVQLTWMAEEQVKDFGNIAEVCIQAWDAAGKPIKAVAPVAGSGCGFGTYDVYQRLDFSMPLGTSTVSDSFYKVKVDRKWESFFESKPATYQISVHVIDQQGRGSTQWEGYVAGKNSTQFSVGF